MIKKRFLFMHKNGKTQTFRLEIRRFWHPENPLSKKVLVKLRPLGRSRALSRIFMMMMISVFLLISCKGKIDTKDRFSVKGTDAIVMSLLPRSPPDSIVVGSDNREIRIIAEVKNLGGWHETGSGITPLNGRIYLSGFDIDIYKFKKSNDAAQENEHTWQMRGKFLEGRNSLNPIGGYEIFEYVGEALYNQLPPDKDTPTFLLTACYEYKTKASAPVCINKDPFNEKIKRICQPQDINTESQGAPIAVTKIEPETLPKKIHFTIHIKNAGGGDVMDAPPTYCNPYEGDKGKTVQRKNADLVRLEKLKLSNIELNPEDICRPLVEGAVSTDKSFIRLIDGEGFVVCSVSVSDFFQAQPASFTTPLEVQLGYTYRNSIQKQIEVAKLVDDEDNIDKDNTGGGGSTGSPLGDIAPDKDDGFVIA